MANPATPGRVRNLVRFLRDCHEADNREAALFDLRSNRVQHLHLLDHGGDFLTGRLDLIPISRSLALEVQKTARLYEAEKTLIFGAFLLTGSIPDSAPPMPRELFAPLIFFPAVIEDADPHAFLRVEAREQRLNAKVLGALLGDREWSAAYLDEILGRIPQAPFPLHRVQDIISAFAEFLPRVDACELVQFPRLTTDAPVDRSRGRAAAPGGIRCLPACAVALVPNSPDTRGVLSELARIASTRYWPAPLRALTGGGSVAPTVSIRRVRLRAPVSLSSAQENALRSAATHPLTLIIGPPGTGKSMTAAALAIEHVLRGQSVLVATRTSQALDVLAHKMELLCGDSQLVLRGGRTGYTRALKESLAQWLEGPPPGAVGDADEVATVGALEREVAAQSRALDRLEAGLRKRAKTEIRWGEEQENSASSSLITRWLRTCRLRLADWQLARQGLYWDLMGHYQRQLQTHHQSVARYLRTAIRSRRQQALAANRREFLALARALRARTDRRQEEWFARINLDLLLRTFPVWLAPLSEVGDLLPFKPALFDLAIVDEATQCDMASCLPVFFRARRIAVTGDPRQLRHLSFLSQERQRLLANKWELTETELEACDYRAKSLLDWVNESIPSQQQVIFLDEHFRSRPQIIDFSNREFYQGALKIMTRRPETTAVSGVELRRVPGRRESGGPNRIEAEAIVAEVVRRVESEKELPPGLAHSLGVLSPFREQVDFLFAQLTRRLGLAAINKHRLRLGTAHSFQGEERDIMFLSFVVDRETHAGALRFLDRSDVFNVAITRARSLQLVFCSLQPEELPERSLLRRYLETISQPMSVSAATPPADAFLEEVQASLAAGGGRTWPCYVVAGLPLDLLVEKNGRSLGIDLVGYPGQFAQAFDLERYRLFQRAGLRLFPLSYSAWRQHRRLCLEAIERWLSRDP